MLGVLSRARDGLGGMDRTLEVVRPTLRFGFQDLVLLRTAKGLAEAKVPAATVRRALKKLRGQLPDGRPLTGVRIAADGRRVVVQDGAAAWNPESGQTLFDFAVADVATAAAPLAKRAAEEARQDGERLTRRRLVPPRLRRRGVLPRRRARRVPPRRRARAASCRRAREPRPPPSRGGQDRRGRGALPHRAHVEAEARGRRVQPRRRARGPRAICARPPRPTSGRSRPTPTFADAHYNLGLLYEKLGKGTAAIRHLSAYKKAARRALIRAEGVSRAGARRGPRRRGTPASGSMHARAGRPP